jgi:hypothetical protein
MGLFLLVLGARRLDPGRADGRRQTLAPRVPAGHHASFAAIVACQIGTAFAPARQHSSLRRIGVLSNPLLLGGIGFEVCSPPR